jgi:DNA end-binding protein Ku
MATAVWTGSMSLGLVVVPVRLYPAIRKKAVRFHEIDRSGRRVRHMRVAEPDLPTQGYGRPAEAEWVPRFETAPRLEAPPRAEPAFDQTRPLPEIAYEELRKGYEVAPGEYVSMSREEVAELAPERSRVIDVQQFVDVSAVDPIYFESRYYIVPDREWSAPFRVLRQALAAADRMALAWFTLRSRRYLSAIRAYNDVMLLTTMVHADEIVAADFWVPDADASPTEKELKMARLLIDTLSGPFEPERYPDEHRQRLLAAIDERTPSVTTAPSAPSPTRVLDLMAALEASVKAAKAARADQDRPAKISRRRSRGA